MDSTPVNDTNPDPGSGAPASSSPAWRRTIKLRDIILPGTTAVLALAIFAVDSTTPYEISAATFYVVIVLLASRFCAADGILITAACCIGLTMASFVITQDGHFRTGIANSTISLIAIVATTYLTIKIQAARKMAEATQAQLTRVARITTLGGLAASIAHEVNQPLAAIVTNAAACTRWMQNEPVNLDKVRDSIDSIVEDARRASAIIARVRALATRAEPKRELVEINVAIEGVLTMIRTQLTEQGIILHARLMDALPMISADRIQLQQVILNLVRNAVDAINEAPDPERTIEIESARDEHGDILVRVADGGIGLDMAQVDHLFDAFHSTKSEGMGIGLSICRSIIEAHEGKIWAMPNRPCGAVFCFTIPSYREWA